MKNLAFLSLLLIAFSCNQMNKSNAIVSGTIKNPQTGKAIYLFKIDGQNIQAVDSTFADSDGSFAFQFKPQEPDFYVINIYQLQKMLLLHDTPLTINTEGTPNGNFQITGSEENQLLQEFMNLRQTYDTQVGSLQSKLQTQQLDESGQQDIRNQYESLTKTTMTQAKTIIEKAQNSFAVLQMFSLLDIENEIARIEKIQNNLSTKYPTSEKIKQLGNEITSIKKTAIGQPAPEINYRDLSGKDVSLASFKGKFVLLDFWASWCRPCRMENPNVVRVYNQYKEKGFEILSISSDRDEQAWKSAIESDKMTWNHIPDLAVNQTISINYNVTAIPMTYLLDKNGIIIAKNLRGQALEDKLVELLKM
jgi:thiol-disulfide isomerase/thioredoxin